MSIRFSRDEHDDIVIDTTVGELADRTSTIPESWGFDRHHRARIRPNGQVDGYADGRTFPELCGTDYHLRYVVSDAFAQDFNSNDTYAPAA